MKAFENTKVRLTAVFLAGIIVCSALMVVGVNGLGIGTQSQLTIGDICDNTTEASYIIFLANGICYAKNGASGAIDYQGFDHAAVIQYAMNALPDGGVVFLKTGTYSLNTALRPGNGISLLGESSSTVKLVNYGITIGNRYIAVTNVTIKNLNLDCNSNSANAWYAIALYNGSRSISIEQCYFTGWLSATTVGVYDGKEMIYDIVFKNNYVTNCWASSVQSVAWQQAAVQLSGVQCGKILGNTVTRCGSNGIQVSYRAQDVLVDGNNIDDVGLTTEWAAGITVWINNQNYEVKNIVISNNIIKNSDDNATTNGILIDAEGSPAYYSYGVTIVGNTIVDNQLVKKGHGIYLHGYANVGYTWNVRGVVVTSNTIYTPVSGITSTFTSCVDISSNVIINPNQHGIWLSGSEKNIVEDNIVRNPGRQQVGVYSGIYIEGSMATYNFVQGNAIYDDTAGSKAGIEERNSGGAPNYNVMINNMLHGTGSPAIIRLGTNSVSTPNYII